ncbi:hypothetical protein D3C85_1723560 [compost metagenome]
MLQQPCSEAFALCILSYSNVNDLGCGARAGHKHTDAQDLLVFQQFVDRTIMYICFNHMLIGVSQKQQIHR